MPDTTPIGGAEAPATGLSSGSSSGSYNTNPIYRDDPNQVNKWHESADTDVSDQSTHHTLGILPSQSASGLKFAQHIHSGTLADQTKKINIANQDLTNIANMWLGIPWVTNQILTPSPADFNNAAFTDFVTGIVIPGTGTLPLWAQDGTAKIDIVVNFNADIITNPIAAQLRLVTNAVNGTPMRIQTPTAATQWGATIGQVGVTIPVGSTISTKIQALTTGASLRLTAAISSCVIVQATVYK